MKEFASENMKVKKETHDLVLKLKALMMINDPEQKLTMSEIIKYACEKQIQIEEKKLSKTISSK